MTDRSLPWLVRPQYENTTPAALVAVLFPRREEESLLAAYHAEDTPSSVRTAP